MAFNTHTTGAISIDLTPFACRLITLPAGVKRIVNVSAKILRENLERGERSPMVMVRDADRMADELIVKSVRILGPSTLGPMFDEPLPGTDGRGICHLVTEASLECET